jgi:hypothetical protein
MDVKKYNDFKKEGGKSNYMFFNHLRVMKNTIEELMEMDHDKIDATLDEHDWASDHISVASENLDQVYHFLLSGKIKGEDSDQEEGSEEV